MENSPESPPTEDEPLAVRWRELRRDTEGIRVMTLEYASRSLWVALVVPSSDSLRFHTLSVHICTT